MKNNNVIIDLKNISVAFDGEPILKDISLYINENEFITLLGPSGCGKTTTLRIIAGFLEPDKGDVIFDGKKINGVPPHKRQINTSSQRYALFPHLNVFEHVAFEKKKKKQNEDLREELHNQNVDNSTKQKVIQQLNNKVEELRKALAEEKKKTNNNEERIKILQDQLDDVLQTLEIAKAA